MRISYLLPTEYFIAIKHHSPLVNSPRRNTSNAKNPNELRTLHPSGLPVFKKDTFIVLPSGRCKYLYNELKILRYGKFCSSSSGESKRGRYQDVCPYRKDFHCRQCRWKSNTLDRELIVFPEGVKSRSAAIEYRIENAKLKRKVGKNQVHAIRVLLSASPEAMERIEQEGRLDDWCEQSVEWMRETFGTENLVSAVLHLDEKTPHIHATVVPIVTATRRKKKSEENVKKHYRKKADGARLCADDIMTQAKLKNYQTSYANAMQPFGLERGVDGSEARHISTREYYTEQYRKAENLKEDISLLAEQKEKVAENLSKAKSELKQTTLKKDISNASSNVARAIGSLFLPKDQQIIQKLNKQISEKDRAVDNLKKTTCTNEILI